MLTLHTFQHSPPKNLEDPMLSLTFFPNLPRCLPQGFYLANKSACLACSFDNENLLVVEGTKMYNHLVVGILNYRVAQFLNRNGMMKPKTSSKCLKT